MRLPRLSHLQCHLGKLEEGVTVRSNIHFIMLQRECCEKKVELRADFLYRMGGSVPERYHAVSIVDGPTTSLGEEDLPSSDV